MGSASERENADLFHGALGAAGSLGITTMIDYDRIATRRGQKKHVRTTYHTV